MTMQTPPPTPTKPKATRNVRPNTLVKYIEQAMERNDIGADQPINKLIAALKDEFFKEAM